MTTGSVKRIQRKRTKGWRLPPDTVYVGRPTKWGNPFVVGQCYFGKHNTAAGYIPYGRVLDRRQAVALYRRFEARKLNIRAAAKAELRGKNLACWCPLDSPCHADVLLRIANG